MTTNFHIIGIDDNQVACFLQGTKERIGKKKVFSSNAHLYEIIKPYLPEKHIWIEIRSPQANVFEKYKPHKCIVVFTSGDPLYFGFTGTIKRMFPLAKIKIYPFFDPIQLLAHRISLTFNNIHIVFFESKAWYEFDNALFLGIPTIGALTTQDKTPRNIAERMLRNGYNNYNMLIGEMLGNREYERIRTLPLEEVLKETFNFPNCIILKQILHSNQAVNIQKNKFQLLNNWNNITTRLPVRLLSISMLDLSNRLHFWEIGFCTSSIPIEVKLQFPHLNVTSFNLRSEHEFINEQDITTTNTCGIIPVINNFMEYNINIQNAPDSVFISAHGERIPEIVEKISKKLVPGGIIVFNSVTEESKNSFIKAIEKAHMKLDHNSRISIDEHNTVTILKATQPI